MTESRFNNFNEFLQRINLTERVSDSGIFVIDINEIAEEALEEFSMYRNEFYEMNLINGMKNFRFAIDGAFYEPNGKPSFYFIAPNQLQSFEVLGDDELATGYIVYIEKDLLRKIEKTYAINFFKREYQSFYQVSEEDYQKTISWADLLNKESQSNDSAKGQILENLLIILLMKMKEVTTEEPSPILSRPNEIIAALYALIDQKNKIPKVADCASELALTPKQLNAVTKKVLGKTANDVIKDHYNEQAKALLIQSASSIKEIALNLGFEEVSNFSRFFKGMNQISPASYRQQKGVN